MTEQPETLSVRLKRAPVTVALFAICLVVFVLAERTGDTTTIETLLRWGADWRGLVWRGEWWRLVTSVFLHVGPVHLIWNVVLGFSWAAPVERALGPARFLLLYLASGVVGSAASVLGHDVVAAGSSGALFGCIGAVFWFDFSRLGDWPSVARARQRDLAWISVWLGFGATGALDNFAHLGGLAAGLSLAWWFERRSSGALAALVANLAVVAVSVAPTFMSTAERRLDAVEQATRDGRAADALALIDEAESKDGRTAYLVASRAWALASLDKRSELDAMLASVSPEHWTSDLRTIQAERLRAKGDPDAGLAVLDQTLANEPEHLGALAARAWVLTFMDAARAPADLAELERLGVAEVPVYRGWAALLRGDLAAARLQASLAPRSPGRSDLEAAIADAGR